MRPDSQQLAERAARLGMVINILLPAVVAIVAYAVHAAKLVSPIESFTSDPPIIFMVFGAVALSELVVAYFMRRALFSRHRTTAIRDDATKVEQWVMRSSLVIFAIGASPMIYGAVLYLLSGDIRQLAFFGIVTLLAYRLFRPTPELLENSILVEPSMPQMD